MATTAQPSPPRSVVGAAVFAYLESVLLFLGGLFVIASAVIASNYLGPSFGRWYTAIGVFIIAVGVLYIVAARRLRTGKGRGLLIALTVITVVAQLISTAYSGLPAGPIAFMLTGLVPPIAAFVLSVQASAGQWIAASRRG
jgi:hypothetical protein